MTETWTDTEINACVRTYLWMRDAEEKGHTPMKTRIREALIDGPMENRSHGSIEYRFQNISAVLSNLGQAWIQGYKPAKNVGAATAAIIEEHIRGYEESKTKRRLDWLLRALPNEIIQQAVRELNAGEVFDYPDSTKFDLVLDEHRLPPKKVIGYAGLLQYSAPLFSDNFSSGQGSVCFSKLEQAGFQILEQRIDHPEDPAFRSQVDRARSSIKLTEPPSGEITPTQREVSSVAYIRDQNVVAYVEERANGVCELCGSPAPFLRPKGIPYLEVHHIQPLSEGGADTIENAAGICPNCHRACHYGSETETLKQKLIDKITTKTNPQAQ